MSATTMMSRRDLAPALVVFAVALAWLLLLRPYGFQLEDEGTHLFWFDRVMRGQQPYVDFHTGYTPGFFAFGKAVFTLFGPSVTALRGVLAVINAVTAAGLTELTRRVAGRWLAPLPALLWLAFVPVYVGEFAAFNVPYPTWPVTLAWVVMVLAMLSWVERRHVVLLVLAGAAAAVAMWFRPNSGAFALAAATWIVAAAAPRRNALDRAAAPLAAGFMAVGIWYAFQFRTAGTDAFVHLVPALAVALLCAAPLSRRLANDNGPGAATSLAWLGGAFLLPTLAWTLPLLSTLGRDRFLYEVFLVGADYQSLYYKPHPSPEPYAVLVVASMLAIAAAGRLVALGRLRPLPVLVAVATAGAVVKLVVLSRGIAPEGVIHSIVAQLENASFWLAVTTSFGALVWLWRAPAAELRRSTRARAMVVLTPAAITMYMQMFPRSDFMHQITAVPLTAVVACALLARVASWWGRGAWPSGWDGARLVRRVVQAAAAGIFVLVFSEKASGPIESWSHPAPAASMPSRLDVHVEAAAGDELDAVASTAAFLRAHTTDGEALWSFPATSGLLFAAGRTSVAPHDYWYPGRPDRAEEARVLGLLRDQRPRFIVTLGKGWNFFAEAPVYFENLRAYVALEYQLAARFGRYDVLARRDVTDPTFPVTAPAAAPSIAAPSARDAVIESNLERRRQAAWRWMEALTPREAAAASLPENSRDTLLLLRALRDGGDMRAAAWAMLGYQSDDARIRGEAVDAMLAMTQALRSRRARFANDFDATSLRPFVEPLIGRAHTLSAIENLRPFADAVLELSGAARPSSSPDESTVPLRHRPRN